MLAAMSREIAQKMATDERNFRSTYYEKVGCRSVPEKKSLEILLKDKPLDKSKLEQFCLRFSVPSTYRNLLWKLLLGVIPMYADCHEFVMDQRRQEFADLLHALTVMRVIDNTTPKPQVFLAVWLLRSRNLGYIINLHSENAFTLIVQSLVQFFDDDTDIFWLAKNFYKCTQKFQGDIPKLVEICLLTLEKEDPLLYRHLQKIGALETLPLPNWFESCFAGILYNNALGKIWDKVCGGSYKILMYVAMVLLTNQKEQLLKCSNLEAVMQVIKNVPEDSAEVIANKTIEIWQHHGSPLTVYDKSKP